jgi:hypothetical protein
VRRATPQSSLTDVGQLAVKQPHSQLLQGQTEGRHLRAGRLQQRWPGCVQSDTELRGVLHTTTCAYVWQAAAPGRLLWPGLEVVALSRVWHRHLQPACVFCVGNRSEQAASLSAALRMRIAAATHLSL